MTDRAAFDPAVIAVAQALGGHRGWLSEVERARVAVDAYRRHVLASRPDGGRWEALRTDAEYAVGVHPEREVGIPAQEALGLLAALADETAARQAAEADRDRVAGRVPDDGEEEKRG